MGGFFCVDLRFFGLNFTGFWMWYVAPVVEF